ncbi:MAG: protein-disulfide reductase DsbD [Woeseiaceae bacterium]|nr:protein-disulfide reductase DsbD [Woeseiaceae bacterium]
MILKRLSWLLLLVAAPLLAQDRPSPPDEVFKYAVFDAGDALEVDWFVDDGAYMYRKAFDFKSGDPAIVFGDVEYPDGEIHSDEFLGEQEIYRGSFLVRIPYTVNGSKPAKVPLTIDSRGCLDSGFCYAPTTWIETVSLKSAVATQKLDFNSLGSNAQSDFPPPEAVFFPDVFVVDGNTVEVGIRIEPDYYVYRDKISVAVKSGAARATSLELPDGKMKNDQFFGEQEVYYLEAVGRVAVARGTTEPTTVEFEVGYQGCAEGGLCYLPIKDVIAVELPAVDKVDDLSAFGVAAVSDPTAGGSTSSGATTAGVTQAAAAGAAPVSEQGRLASIITGSSLWIVIATFFGAGLLLAFTPCVLPMIPILSGIIAGDGDNVSPIRGFTLSLSYVMGMALVYTAAGIVAAAAGLQLQAAFNAPWVLIVFAGLFVVLAMSMFGMFELQMPSSIQSRLAAASGNQKSGTMVGAFVMGALSSLIVTACVAPPLVATLTVIGQTGDMLRGGLALFAMSLGMGAPLLLVGASAGQLLPKAGAWMEAVKGAFGFMMLALAIWMLSRFLPGEITLALWAVLVFMAGVFLGGLTSLGADSTAAQKLGKGFGTLGMIYGVLLLLGSLTGGTNPLQPLASVNLGGGEAVKEEKLQFQIIKTVDDLDHEVALAASQGKTVMLDFWAEWCVSCKEMEAFTFTDEEVQATLAGTVLLKADVTANDEADQALLARFGVFGPPTIIFFGPDGQQRHGYEVVGYMKAASFSEHVRQAFSQSAAITAQITE